MTLDSINFLIECPFHILSPVSKRLSFENCNAHAELGSYYSHTFVCAAFENRCLVCECQFYINKSNLSQTIN